MSDQPQDAIGHLPHYITPPGETDTLFVAVVVLVVLAILFLGVLYLKLHSIPEKIAHSSNHTQFQLVAVLGLLALFTHNNIFWVLALVLATIQLPDYEGLLTSIARSLERISGLDKEEQPAPAAAGVAPAPEAEAPASAASETQSAEKPEAPKDSKAES